LAPIRPEDVVFGQYGAGTIGGAAVPGYRNEPDIAPDSKTETFANDREANELLSKEYRAPYGLPKV